MPLAREHEAPPPWAGSHNYKLLQAIMYNEVVQIHCKLCNNIVTCAGEIEDLFSVSVRTCTALTISE